MKKNIVFLAIGDLLAIAILTFIGFATHGEALCWLVGFCMRRGLVYLMSR